MNRFLSFLLLILLSFFSNQAIAQFDEAPKKLEKNTGYVGLLFSYSQNSKENSKVLLDNVKYSKSSSTSVNTGGGYFFKENFAVGMGVTYDSNLSEAESINTFGPNTLSDSEVFSWFFNPFIRNYFPIGQTNQFYIFTQTGLEYGFGNGTETAETGNSKEDYDISERSYGIAFTPGMIFLVKQGFAFELNVGVVGIERTEKKKISSDPDVLPEIQNSTKANLNINLLQLNLGLSYYF
ncbi:DUF3575 domain-containing protein [Algoriphagus sp. PAP.12]|uniref:DUF3575 domain-containing protein n=1 Tax=Algoriphagus sp. PAP.12 TaxID=2996678 RepID=UPI00227CADAF|nr:DUF3575 domain-containing protein [Algoriphagus sp. PAP.12]